MVTVARLVALLEAKTADFDRAMDRSHGKMSKLGAVAGIAGTAIVTGVAYGLEKSVKAAIAAQISQARLAQSFTDAHLAMAPYLKSIDSVERASRKLGFTDEDTKTALGSLITATRSYSLSVKDLTTARTWPASSTSAWPTRPRC